MYGEYQGKQLEIRFLCDVIPQNATDVVKWVDTDVMLADPLTKATDASKLMDALDNNYWSCVQPHESIIKKRAKQIARSKTKPQVIGSL